MSDTLTLSPHQMLVVRAESLTSRPVTGSPRTQIVAAVLDVIDALLQFVRALDGLGRS